MPVSLSSVTQIVRTMEVQATLSAIWSGSKDRLISIIRSGSGSIGIAFTAGTAFGIAAVWAVDRYFQQKNLAQRRTHGEENSLLSGKELKNRLGVIEFTLGIVVLCAGLVVFNEWLLTGRVNTWSNVFFCSLAAGFVLGVQIKEHYNKNDESTIDRLVTDIKTSSLSHQLEYLRWLNLDKIRKKLYKNVGIHSRKKYLMLENCGLINSDLKRLGESGWFNHLEQVDISGNPLLTSSGLQWIGTGKSNTVKELDLSKTDLTDDDLRLMAGSGYFKNLETLIISDNPQITGRGLAAIIESGFEGLRNLSVINNDQIFTESFDTWIGKRGFANLESFDISCTGVSTDQLSQMIGSTCWVKNLKGLNLDGNNLGKFPDNISELTHLDEHRITGPLLGASIYYRGIGLFVRGCNISEYNEGIIKLFGEGKVYGDGLELGRQFWLRFKKPMQNGGDAF